MLILLLHPHVQKKAQTEIDGVLGQKRLPNFGDRESLPYINCVMQESMRYVRVSTTSELAYLIRFDRWHPASPTGEITLSQKNFPI